eukprot:TRINITY_DN6688_c0_g1_i1.p1 TRINITY_DN6688_c0_g1~~TRINITY_DN6688_c0_g1_i1.p1  ORF type:complete len:258 (+),score=62.93 TRINITY_DN6688_c0_g1_i1:33-776(+)
MSTHQEKQVIRKLTSSKRSTKKRPREETEENSGTAIKKKKKLSDLNKNTKEEATEEDKQFMSSQFLSKQSDKEVSARYDYKRKLQKRLSAILMDPESKKIVKTVLEGVCWMELGVNEGTFLELLKSSICSDIRLESYKNKVSDSVFVKAVVHLPEKSWEDTKYLQACVTYMKKLEKEEAGLTRDEYTRAIITMKEKLERWVNIPDPNNDESPAPQSSDSEEFAENPREYDFIGLGHTGLTPIKKNQP